MKSPGNYLPGPLLFRRSQVWPEFMFVRTGLVLALGGWDPLGCAESPGFPWPGLGGLR